MDYAEAIRRGIEARANGNKSKVFDWDKAARIIKEKGVKTAGAGLQGDLEWTGGKIFRDGKPLFKTYTYLASVWATPILIIDDEEIPCFIYGDETDWGASTLWPESALKIIKD